MNKLALFAVMVTLCFSANAQKSFYINPGIAAAWCFTENSNPSISANGNPAGGNADYYLSFLLGYELENHLIIESGIQYHDALNRYYWGGSDSSLFVGGSFSTEGQGYLDIPINVKYNYQFGESKFSMVPYVGVTISTGSVDENPYYTLYQDNFPHSNDTVAVASAFGYNDVNVLINAGVSFEYAIFERLILTASGNFTFGFRDMNKVHVDVVDQKAIVESGDIVYKGNKFYLSGGLKIPLF